VGIYWVVDHQQNVLRCREIWHPPWVSAPGFIERSWELVFPPGVGIPGAVWQQGEPLWLPDVLTDPRFLRVMMASREGVHGTFLFPIPAEGAVYGVMEFFSHVVRPENAELAQAMATIGRQVGQFIERKLAEEALEHQAMHDALTDLPNRSLLFDRLNQALLTARRTRRPLTLFIMDLDKFKQVNDTFGHHYGDLLLQEAASRLHQTLRGSDTVARLGGDEFAMLLPGTDENGAIQAAEKVVAALEQPFVLEGQSLEVGVSVGIALCPQHGGDPSALLQAADAAMYLAKRGNRHFAIYDSDVEGHASSESGRGSNQSVEPGELSRS
jgi:diguanylate cyclase (GGDEF)-like protein